MGSAREMYAMVPPTSRRFKHTMREKEILVALVKTRMAIVDSKKNDIRSLQMKKDAWNKITMEYNSMPDIQSKVSPKQLKKFWQNLKCRAGKDGLPYGSFELQTVESTEPPVEIAEVSNNVYRAEPDELDSLVNDFDGDNKLTVLDIIEAPSTHETEETENSDSTDQIQQNGPASPEQLPNSSSIFQRTPISLLRTTSRPQRNTQKRKQQEESLNNLAIAILKEEHVAKMKRHELEMQFLDAEHRAKMAIYEKQLKEADAIAKLAADNPKLREPYGSEVTGASLIEQHVTATSAASEASFGDEDVDILGPASPASNASNDAAAEENETDIPTTRGHAYHVKRKNHSGQEVNFVLHPKRARIEEDSPNRMFLLSMLPHLEKLPPKKLAEAQVKLLTVLTDLSQD